MLANTSIINGYDISASDGHIGFVSDFLFDDVNWHVRWLVVETGQWLSSRRVIVPSSALSALDPKQAECRINLSMQQIKDSPEVDTLRPVSQQMEASIYGHYGYKPYWNDGSGFGGIGYLGGFGFSDGFGNEMPPSSEWSGEVATAKAKRQNDDVHLRSINEVTGYHIEATDGQIGHIEDFLVEDADWSIRYVVADTRNWWPGKKVLISPRSVKDVDWAVKMVHVDVKRKKIKDAPAYDEFVTIDQEYQSQFLRYYDIDSTNI